MKALPSTRVCDLCKQPSIAVPASTTAVFRPTVRGRGYANRASRRMIVPSGRAAGRRTTLKRTKRWRVERMQIYLDSELKQALAKMLPARLKVIYHFSSEEPKKFVALKWSQGDTVRASELLHICYLVEETRTIEEKYDYFNKYLVEDIDTPPWKLIHLSWRERTSALAKTKGVKIV